MMNGPAEYGDFDCPPEPVDEDEVEAARDWWEDHQETRRSDGE